MKIIPLSEGAFTIDKTKLFVPFDTHKDDLQQRAPGSLLVEVQPFVIVTSEDVLLLDTGLGFEQEDVLQIHRNLMNAGINPSEITKVLMSHLHKDHAGGISKKIHLLASLKLLFPKPLIIYKTGVGFALEKACLLIYRKNCNACKQLPTYSS